MNAEDLLNEELKTINWKDVDQYPSFSVCDSTSGKEQRKLCFETTLTKHITSVLSRDIIVVSEAVQDTIIMTFTISDKGILAIKEIESDVVVKEEIPNIDTLLYQSIDNLPSIFPAIKRGQHVSTEFRLPIIVNAH